MKRVTYFFINGLAFILMLLFSLITGATAAESRYHPSINLLLLSGQKLNVVEINDDINSPTTWKSNNLYVINEIIDVNSTLFIEAGTIIKFHRKRGMTINGSIIADGTSDKPIIFTSINDDAHGGDTNNDKNYTTPNKGDWHGILLNSTTQMPMFNYCNFLYGGSPWPGSTTPDYVTLDFYRSKSKITNCTFTHNLGNLDRTPTLWFTGALNATWALPGTIIRNNRFYDNVLPITIGPKINIDDSNSFQSQDGAQKNVYNGIFIETNTTGDNDIESNTTWNETEVAFVTSEFGLDIWDGASLTLGNNVVIKFAGYPSGIGVSDLGTIYNYNGNGVFFTSFKDDGHKGDTNGDGSLTSPAKGDWEGIYKNLDGEFAKWPNILYSTY